MSEYFLQYLEREHARLEAAIAEELRRPQPDPTELRRLKKTKLLVKDQIVRWQRDSMESLAA